MRESTQILLRRRANPHRFGSLDYRRFNILLAVVDSANPLVGNFIASHNFHGPLDQGGLGDRWHATRYLKYMRDRGYLELPGEVFVTRGPRVVPVGTLSSDLNGLTFGVELECYLPNGHTHSSGARAVTEAGVDCHAEI